MDGKFLGGGAIDHIVWQGDIYLKAEHLAILMGQAGMQMGMVALEDNNGTLGNTAHMMLTVSERLYELRSELLKREAEALLGPPGTE